MCPLALVVVAAKGADTYAVFPALLEFFHEGLGSVVAQPQEGAGPVEDRQHSIASLASGASAVEPCEGGPLARAKLAFGGSFGALFAGGHAHEFAACRGDLDLEQGQAEVVGNVPTEHEAASFEGLPGRAGALVDQLGFAQQAVELGWRLGGAIELPAPNAGGCAASTTAHPRSLRSYSLAWSHL